MTKERLAFEVRLVIFYLLLVSAIPTSVVFSNWGNLEATEEEWNWVLGWSFILLGPVLGALYLAFRNIRRMPFLFTATTLFAFWHIGTTVGDYGYFPHFIPDMDPGTPIDLDVLYFLRFSMLVALPFVSVYLAWRLFLRHRSGAKLTVS